MGFIKKLFRTEHVYAGPQQMRKNDEFDMGDVYAGPQQLEEADLSEGAAYDNSEVTGDEIMDSVNENPEKKNDEENGCTKPKRIPPRHTPNDALVQAVYAAPDVMEKMRVPDQVINRQSAYPFNNASTEALDSRMMNTNAMGIPGFSEKGMASFEIPKGFGEGNGAFAETIICPACGEKTRHGKFCEYCGTILK